MQEVRGHSWRDVRITPPEVAREGVRTASGRVMRTLHAGTVGAMGIDRTIPNITVPDRAALETSVREHAAVLGVEVLMDHGWIVTLGDRDGHQLSIMTQDATASVNPAVSCFLTTVDEVQTVLGRVVEQGLEVVHLLSEEPWGVTRFFYRDSAGTVINVGTHT
jgi:predicted enzyme related to lactoylglutathione lyase